MLLLGSLGGLRVGEMAILQAENINDGIIRVTGKGGHIRHVPVHPLLDEALQLAPTQDWIFPSHRNPSGHYLPASIAQRINDLPDLARHLGISRSAVSLRMNGGRDFSLAELASVAEWLDITLAELLGPEILETRRSPHTDLVGAGASPGGSDSRQLPRLDSNQ